jgi:hypothetical protein
MSTVYNQLVSVVVSKQASQHEVPVFDSQGRSFVNIDIFFTLRCIHTKRNSA